MDTFMISYLLIIHHWYRRATLEKRCHFPSRSLEFVWLSVLKCEYYDKFLYSCPLNFDMSQNAQSLLFQQ